MKVAYPPCQHVDWRTLYRTAILETDKNAILRRISEAEEAVISRGRELFHREINREEQEALEDALYALRAYRTACQHAETA